MIESIKSVLLTVLILTSFVQSGILLYSSPSYEERLDSTFTDPQKIGSQEFEKQGIHQLAAPGQILLHEDGEHRQVSIGPENKDYRRLLEKLHLTRFKELQEVTPSAKDWDELLNEKRGVELRFNRNLPPDTMQAFFSSDLEKLNLDSISRVWFYDDPKSKQLFVRFISDETGETVQGKASLNAFDDWMGLAKGQDAARLAAILPAKAKEGKKAPDPLYLPEAPLPVKGYTYPLKEIRIDDLKQVLFQDPDLAKQILELDNSKIYTDSNRTLQHNTKADTIVYNRPDPATAKTSTLAEQLDLINTFMNRHGGWTGNFLLDEVQEDPDQKTPFLRFRLYTRNLPIYWEGGEKTSPATIRLAAVNKGVTSYERSLWYLAPQPVKERTVEKELPGKDDFLKELNRRGLSPEKDVQTVYPGYRAVPGKKVVTLLPVWVIQLKDGTRNYVEARKTGRETAWTGAKPKPY
ncbi:YycH family regulatory protein [Salinithrix halophila]|uniref:YycH family regulatory protein n=1 Tax=Salinithrix halophila TaxID=1485204 RepID=A0ABV8JMN6_9BACL